MPALAKGRASKACDLCRKHKTRCYPSAQDSRRCLRCSTLSKPCSLMNVTSSRSHSTHRHLNESPYNDRPSPEAVSEPPRPQSLADQRLERLERVVQGLIDRLDSQFGDAPEIQPPTAYGNPGSRMDRSYAVTERDPAPILVIQDAAVDAGVDALNDGENMNTSPMDVINSGLVGLSTALSLIQLFREHYGRWVKFSHSSSAETLLSEVRKSPLLLSSVCLIAVRHTTLELADTLAPKLFEEAKSLLQSSLLTVPQTLHFFQAVLVLSLWSTTIGQVVLSVDSWLLTGYALQQALASLEFEDLIQAGARASASETKFDVWCIWNHICLAHLQYCVGTRRPLMLSQSQMETCVSLLKQKDVDNFESRMAAEVKLYWIIAKNCSAPEVNLAETVAALESWHQECSALFSQPRSQFLEMGHEFAYLITHYQSLKSSRAIMGRSILENMITRCQKIISLVVGTADDRTPHLTDHVYIVVAFSALTLCRLVHTYETQLREANHDIAALDDVVIRLVKWMRTIGLPCHVAPLLGRIVLAQLKSLRPDVDVDGLFSPHGLEDDDTGGDLVDMQSLSANVGFPYPDLIGSELFYMSDGPVWPQWC